MLQVFHGIAMHSNATTEETETSPQDAYGAPATGSNGVAIADDSPGDTVANASVLANSEATSVDGGDPSVKTYKNHSL